MVTSFGIAPSSDQLRQKKHHKRERKEQRGALSKRERAEQRGRPLRPTKRQKHTRRQKQRKKAETAQKGAELRRKREGERPATNGEETTHTPKIRGRGARPNQRC